MNPPAGSSGSPPNQARLIDSAWNQVAEAGQALAQDRPTLAFGGRSDTRVSGLPDAVPGYRILSEVHRGGQGVVYRALQESTGRTVALKVMLGGAFAGPSARARFAREVQILAGLRHPNIVTIHDSGSAGDAQFFVMDFVDGLPLDRFVAETALPLDERLRLFVRICDAVNAAHLRGIIHRDLKPSNILVAKGDEGGTKGSRDQGTKGEDASRNAPSVPRSLSPSVPSSAQPKILDFGLARHSEDRDSADAPALTLTGQFVGSLAWASPEQARGRQDQIDLRSDVYALGVILYQLLTSALPYDVGGGFETALQSILHADPPDPRIINRQLSDDLAAIVLKALRKERELRYETAGSLGREVERYLAGDSIEAKRDNSWYLLRRAIRRNRSVVIAGSLVAATLLLATGVSLRFALQARREREQARANAEETRQVAEFQSDLLSGIDVAATGRGIKELLREQVHAGLERGQVGEWPNRRARTSEEIDARLADYDAIVETAQPADVARRVLDRYVLGDMTATVESTFAGRPGVQASLMHTLGAVYHALGLNDKAEPALRRALELLDAQHPTRGAVHAGTIAELAGVLSDTGRASESEGLHREALAIYRREQQGHEANIVRSLSNVAVLRGRQGDYSTGESLLREALAAARALDPANREVLADCLGNLGAMGAHQAKYDDAEAAMRESLDLRRASLGEGHEAVALSLANLGGVLLKRGNAGGAEKLLRESLDIYRSKLGDEHADVVFAMSSLAHVLRELGDRGAAKALYTEALALSRKVLGNDHTLTALIVNDLATTLRQDGDDRAAEPLLRESLELRRTKLGDEHPDVAQSMNNLALLLLRRGDAAAAEPLYRQAVQICELRFPPNHDFRIIAQIGLSRAWVKLGRWDEAETRLTALEPLVAESAALSSRGRAAFHEAFIELYEALGAARPSAEYEQKAAQWRERLTQWRASTQPATP